VDRTTYVHKAFTDHLSDTATYQSLSPTEASVAIKTLSWKIFGFVSKHHDDLRPADQKFILASREEVKDPYPHFYLTFKIHKMPLKTRPIVLVSGSLLHALGRWLDIQLQPLIQKLPSFIASSLELIQCFDRLPALPPQARLFLFDAVSMYTNIDTDHALNTTGHFLRNHKLAKGLPANAIISALDLIMRWNIFKFVDTFWKQLRGTAMGTPPACMYATLYFAIHELAMPAHLQRCLALYKRYIDDRIGIWTGSDANWIKFQT
jgi:hypothetical protein